MKKLIMTLAMAVGMTGFAAQNDKLIAFSTPGPDCYADGKTVVVDGECYALVWIRSGASFGGFNSDGTLCDAADNAIVEVAACAKGGKADYLFQIPIEDVNGKYAGGSFSVYLLDTRDDAGRPSEVVDGAVSRVNASGVCKVEVPLEGFKKTSSLNMFSTVGSRATLLAAGVEGGAEFGTTSDAYADNKQVLDGECYALLGYPTATASEFGGLDWNGTPLRAGDDIIFLANAAGGKCPTTEIPALKSGFTYEIAVLDSRLPDEKLSEVSGSGIPTFIRAWGLIRTGDEGTTSTVWNPVRIGATGVFNPITQKPFFTFDPSQFLDKGYAAVYGLLDYPYWTVFPLPQADVKILDEKVTLQKGDNYEHLGTAACPDEAFDLDIAYQFSAFTNEEQRVIVTNGLNGVKAWKILDKVLNGTVFEDDPDQTDRERKEQVFRDWYMACVPFFQWNADFEISFNHEVKAGSVILAGSYEQAAQYGEEIGKDFSKWVGAGPEQDMKQGQVFRLLASNSTASVTLNYQEVCERVQKFLCGVHNLSNENWGTTMRVDLKLYENTGKCNEKNGGVQPVVGTYRYTFEGPLNVKFYTNGSEIVELAISTNHNGLSEIPLPVLKGDDKKAFVGWATSSEEGAEVTYTNTLPACTWTPDDTCLNLYAAWKKAQVVTVSNETAQIKDQQIKVTDEWVQEVLGTDPEDKSKVQEKLNEPVGTETEKGEMKKWEAYVLGLDPTDPTAAVKVEKTNGAEEDKAIVISTVQAPPPDSGFKVAYSLDKVDKTTEQPIDDEHTGEPQETKDLKIELEPQSGETPTGYYKMNVIITSVDGEGKEGDEVKVAAENTIGVLKVETEDKIIPVAVPWNSLAKNDDVTVDEVVKTSTLSENDMMHVYDSERKAYDNWQLIGGVWTPVKSFKIDDAGNVTQTEVDKPTSTTVSRGAGVWLERQDVTKPFYLIGQYDSKNPAKSKVVPPTKEQQEEKRPEYNLIAPTGIEETDLNSVPALVADDHVVEGDDGDKLMVLRNGVPNYYTRKYNKWGYNQQVFVKAANGFIVTRTQREENDAKVPAGLGLWYISNGGNPEIQWEEAKGAEQ